MSSMKTHEMLEEENDRMVEQMASKVAALKSVSYFQENAPPRKIFKFRQYESASEAVGDHINHAKCGL